MNKTQTSENSHPGEYIRLNVLPKGMKVTEAASHLGIGRPALSNLLNGNAALSPDMAARIERAFGISARELMDMQAAYDMHNAKEKGTAALAKPYVPLFLQLKAKDIEDWSENISARTRLAVFLRTLVNSTGLKLTRIEFPGNDDAERPGWDGFVEAEEATPWIPLGKSGWEFGVNQEPKKKADQDYTKSIKQIPEDRERQEITFVFVTPRRWDGKAVWEKQRRAERKWKDVRVLDASDLEQWLEQSIPAQAWLANERGQPSQGVWSLDTCWQEWEADCDPKPISALFDAAVERARPIVKTKLSKSPSEPLVISADSTLEALAFLHCLFSLDDPDLSLFRDRLIVFNTPGTLSKLVTNSPHFIAIVPTRDVEKELAQHGQKLRSVIIYPRNATNAVPDIILEPLGYGQFSRALQAMGCNHEEIQRRSRESGRSLTILRRRLSKLDVILTPTWAVDRHIAKLLIPFLFAGAWKATNSADQAILELLAEDKAYSDLEGNIASLHQLEDSPVWSVGEFRGLTSKIDVLFSINRDIVENNINKFLEIAQFVLSEDDPSLDLPEDRRWAANLYGKSREISKALRDGICETLVLLAIHGDSLLGERLGINVELRIGRLVTSLLTPLTARVLEAHSSDLPLYAESAPTTFLELIENDLKSDNSQSIALMRPADTSIFGRCPRTGLLWALENLAWSPEHLARIVLILARVAEIKIDDNWANKPNRSLSAIFHNWMPQTAASLEQRIAALDLLIDRFPQVAWNICVEQFNGRLDTGHFSHKPRWRTDGYGYGEPITRGEASKFVRHALDRAIAWKQHDRATIGDLIGNVNRLLEEDQEAIWNLIEEWSKKASEIDKSWLRERIRVGTLTRRGLKRTARHGDSEKVIKRARLIYEMLLPSDVVLKHEWLFRNTWVDESADELEEEEMDFRKRDERILDLRERALKEILREKGMPGILALAEMGEASDVIGWFLSRILKKSEEFLEAIRFILDRGPLTDSASRKSIIFGALASMQQEQAVEILPSLIKNLKAEEFIPVLTLCPFNSMTWNLVNLMGKEIEDGYWANVHFNLPRNSTEELQYAVDKFIGVGRPRAAFQLARLYLENLQPKQLFRLMMAIMSKDAEPPGTYRLEAYSIRKAFDRLNESGEISMEEMAVLEFMYIDLFDRNDYKIPNLEKHIEKNPDLYVQAVALAYKRDDNGEDPAEFQSVDSEQRQNRARAAFLLLEKLRRIPGYNRVGELDSKDIEKWIDQVRAGCKSLARERACELSLGKLFANAPLDDDGAWPCKPVRDVLEKIITEPLASSLTAALYNVRGAHWRGEGGQEERNLAEKYKNWARTLQFTHPQLSKILMQMVATYEREANWHDMDAQVRKRLQD